MAKFVKKRMEQNGLKVKYVWCRWFPGFADPFHFIIKKIFRYNNTQYKSLRPIKLLYQYFIFIDHLVWLFFKVVISNKDIIVMDRYLYDVLVDLYMLGIKPSPFFIKLIFLYEH